MKVKIYFLAMAFVALLMVGCSDDESGIRFTQDEIQGDINTGKQVGVENNSLVIYTTEGGSVNVQGAKGKISAKSSDENVVTVTCNHEAGQYGKGEQVILKSVAIGKAIVTVTDEDGNEAKLAVEVKDVETLWKISSVNRIYDKKCLVEGVSREDSLAIATAAIESKPYDVFRFLFRSYNTGLTVARLQIRDNQKHVFVDGYYFSNYSEDGSILYCYIKNMQNPEGILESFYLKPKVGPYLYWDLTEKYKKAYPQVTKVELYYRTEPLS